VIIVMERDAKSKAISDIIAKVRQAGYEAHLAESMDDAQTLIGVVGESDEPLDLSAYGALDGVQRVEKGTMPYPLASREYHPKDSLVPLNGSHMGGNKVLVIAGPCSVEGREAIIESAYAMKEAGATALRGGAFKPRTSPYSFQGHGELGLQWMAEAREKTGLPIVTEVMDPALVPMVCEYADVLQIGARNMQNFTLLHAVGASQHPILLKRGMSSTIEDLLMAAEYILSHGNRRVMLCERGIRTFEKATRNTFDINAIPVLKQKTHLPVVADPSHGVGYREYVTPVALAAVAAGADGLIIETHPIPDKALSDGRQSLDNAAFKAMIEQVRLVAQAVGRTA
jgi:3-deoxy-7-phosphoheptulonate synthase